MPTEWRPPDGLSPVERVTTPRLDPTVARSALLQSSVKKRWRAVCGSMPIRTFSRKILRQDERTRQRLRTWASACVAAGAVRRRCAQENRRRSWTTKQILPTRSRRWRNSPDPAQIDEIIRIINDGFAELRQGEGPFPRLGAQVSLDAPTPASPKRASDQDGRARRRSTPTSPASRSTGRNTCHSGRR